jgi:quercetin dioxygenase-like cupin family protein
VSEAVLIETDINKENIMQNRDGFRIVKSGKGTTYEFPGFAMTIVFLATADDTDDQVSVFESIHKPGSGAPLHIHHHQHEMAYIVTGEFLIQSGDEPLQRVGPGAYVYFPKGLPHAFKCIGDTTGKILFTMMPGGFERFFAEAAEVIGSGPPNMEAMVAIGKKHDSDIVGPPIQEAE